MMKSTFILSVFFAVAATTFSCEYDREEDEIVEVTPVDTTTTTDTTTTDTTTTDTTTTPVADTYENKIKAIVDLNCATNASCHGSGASGTAGDFRTYTILKIDADNGNLKTQVVDLKEMPYGPVEFVTPSDRKVFEDWLADGAPEK